MTRNDYIVCALVVKNKESAPTTVARTVDRTPHQGFTVIGQNEGRVCRRPEMMSWLFVYFFHCT
jgi:hypothetical protein